MVEPSIHQIPRIAWEALDAAFREAHGWRQKVGAAVRLYEPFDDQAGGGPRGD